MKKKIISIVLISILLLSFSKIAFAVDDVKYYKYTDLNDTKGTYYYKSGNSADHKIVYWVRLNNDGSKTVAKLILNEANGKYEYKGTDELKYLNLEITADDIERDGHTTQDYTEGYLKWKALIQENNNSYNSVTLDSSEYEEFKEEDKENREFAYEYWENYQKNQEQEKDYTKQEVNLKEVNLDKIVTDANSFLDKGSQVDEDDTISEEKIQDLSNLIYNVLLVIGIVVAVVIGGILGIQFITSGAEGKADIKQMLVPYVIGVVVLFGAFTIWKIVLVTLQG